MSDSDLCHCGKPLHYTDKKVEAAIRRLVFDLGEHVKVTVGGRAFLVQRHYIALHGLKGEDVSKLGFTEIV
jgi:hypothetical protein